MRGAAIGRTPVSLSGGLSATGSSATITGNTRTWTVPAGHPGVIRFESVSTDGAGAVQYSKNGGAFTTVVSNDEVTFANGDTIAMQTTGLSVGQSGSAILRDKATGIPMKVGSPSNPYTWSRTS
jgi:hypothetical protein